MTAAFAMASGSIVHLSVSNRLDCSRKAQSLAEAAAQLALARIAADDKFGTTGTAAQKSLTATFPWTEGQGRVTFDAGQAASWKIPPSLNNLAEAASASGHERTIAPHSLQILAQGQAGGVVRWVEVVATLPPYKFALACSGTLESSGGLQILGVKDPAAVAGGVQNLPPEQIQPGHVACNANSAQSLTLDSSLGQPSLVTGDAQTCGTIQLGQATTVQGSLKEHHEPAALPKIQIADFDPSGLDNLNALSDGVYTSALDAAGLVRRQGDLKVTNGGLQMDGAYVYVDGDVEIWGGLHGKGVLFATGDIRIHGQSSFVANEAQALVAGGNLSLGGNSQNGSFFQGMAYTEGDFEAKDLTMVGSFVGAKTGGGGSSIDLQKTNVVHSPKTLKIDFGNPVFVPLQIPNTQLTGAPLPTGLGGAQYLCTGYRVADPASLYNSGQDAFDPALAQTAPIQMTILDSPTGEEFTGDLNAAAAWIRGRMNPQPPLADLASALQAACGGGITYYRTDVLAAQVAEMDELYQKTKLPSLRQGSFEMDPNQFVQISDRLRKVLWREF